MNKPKILIFGGTTEGRLLAEFCAENNIDCEVSVATEYGASLLPSGTDVHIGRLDRELMRELISKTACTFVVDATHPYAAEASENISAACISSGIAFERLIRETSEIHGETVDSIDRLVELLNECDDNIFCTLGSKALPELAAVKGCRERMWVRVLPAEGITYRCAELGYDRDKVICAKGSFSVEENLECLERSHAGILVTKESGAAGGYPEKAAAAERYGARLITLLRPREEGLSMNEMRSKLLRMKGGAYEGIPCRDRY